MKDSAQKTETFSITIPTREEIYQTYNQGPEAVVTLFYDFANQFMAVLTTMQQRLLLLEDQVAKNSSNSSKPPSTDGYRKENQTKSLRKKSGKKPGGQKGHKGVTLEQVDNPDDTVLHQVQACGNCNASLKDIPATDIEKRQVHDIEIKLSVTEHKAEKKECPHCGSLTTGEFPEDVKQPVQYGPLVLSLAVYFSQWQLIPLWRTKQTFSDIFHIEISESTILAATEKAAVKIAPIINRIKCYLIYLAVLAHFDETGIRVAGALYWIHSISTEKLTFYAVHKKRGDEAMQAIGILPLFLGIALHDHWDSYFKYLCLHALCNAHHLRELEFLIERYDQKWAKKMVTHLLVIKEAVEGAKLEGKKELAEAQLTVFSNVYDQIVNEGFIQNPFITPVVKKRGKVKRTKAQNLLLRLQKNKQETLRFMYDFRVPFDNNQAERDIRMVKLKQKISGCFRTFTYAEIFCNIRSYLSTVRKHNHSILAAIESVFLGTPYIPEALLVIQP